MIVSLSDFCVEKIVEVLLSITTRKKFPVDRGPADFLKSGHRPGLSEADTYEFTRIRI